VFYLTGSADNGTGSFERNSFLSTNRVNRVKTYLKNKFGIPENRIVIKAAIVSDKHEDGRLDRCVLFENE
ncbi:MAG: OmpA family protein, partial [Bacteroidales bacterium]|nr:OmpA family protein [Candidatus Equibacterium intestinale]